MNPALGKPMAAADAAMAATGETQPAEPKDRRAETSPENGQKHKATNWGKVAEEYLGMTGRRIIWRREGFYEYDPRTGAYRLNSKAEMSARAGSFLRSGKSRECPTYSLNAERNLVGVLGATDDLSLLPPAFLDTGGSAAGWIAMRNGLLNVEAAARGEREVLREYTPNFFSTISLPYDWNPDAPCPRFMRFIEDAQPEEDARTMCQMLAGLLLVPDTSFQTFWILYGPAGTGKSTFKSIIAGMLGRENVCCVPLADFTEKFTVGLLTQKLANLVDDGPTADGYHATLGAIEGILKRVTGGRAELKLEPKGVDGDTSRFVIARSVFCQNPPLPMFSDRTDGVWRRLRLIPFMRVFYGTAQQNRHLDEEVIATELPGVFRWAVEGLGKLRELNCFPQCAEGKKIIEDHQATCDREKTFLEERYRVANGQFTPAGEMYKAYKEWCGANGYQWKNSGNFKGEVLRVFPDAIHLKKRYLGSPQWGFLNVMDLPKDDDEDAEL